MALKNFPITLVASAPNTPTAGTSLSVTPGQGNRLPDVPFKATAVPAGQMPTLDNAEIVNVTAISTDTLTIQRAQGGSSAKPIAIGWQLFNGIYAEDIDRLVSKDSIVINAKDYGLISDGRRIVNITASSSSPNVSSTSGDFTAADVGKTCIVINSSGAGVVTTIQSVTDVNNVVLAVNAGITTGLGTLILGTDDSASIQAALNVAGAKVALGVATDANQPMGSGHVRVVIPGKSPQSMSIITSQISIPAGVILDAECTIANLLTSRNQPSVLCNNWAIIQRLEVENAWGTGMMCNNNNNQAHIVIDNYRTWHTGGSSVGPTGLSGTASTTGGTLSATTRYYVVVGVDAQGAESIPSNEITLTTTTSTGSNSLSWSAMAGAVKYRLYRGTVSGNQNLYYETTSTSFVDTNTGSTSARPTPPGFGLYLKGFHYEINKLWIKSAKLGVYHNSGSDCNINYAYLVGCVTGVRMNSTNQINYTNAFLDTCGGTGTLGGFFIDNNCSDIHIRAQAFTISSALSVLSPVVALGQYTNGTSKVGFIDLDIQTNNTGGSVLALANAQDVTAKIHASNWVFSNSATNPITTAVVYGSGLSGFIDIDAHLSATPASITPYTGTPSGNYKYVLNNRQYFANGLANIDVAGKGNFVGVDAGSQKITAVADPAAAQDAATKNYVDAGTATMTNKTIDATLNKVTKTLYSVTVGTANSDYNYNGTDISVAINAAIANASASAGVDIFIKAGNYTIANPILLKDKANLQIRGAGKELVTLTANGGSFAFFDMVNAAYRYKFSVSDLSLDNTSPAAGSTGFSMGLLSDSTFSNVTIKNFETGLKLTDGMFYNSFTKVDTENCLNAVTFTSGATDKPNSNSFVNCKFLSDATFINSQNSASKQVNTITINSGNQNSFISCQIENFNRGIYINDIGNTVVSCRLESNDVSAANVYVSTTASGKNNQFTGNYYSGNNYLGRTTSITNSGPGNAFWENATYKDQFLSAERNLTGADDFMTLTRSGSGDAKGVIVASDTYANSGAPIQFMAKSVRSAGKYFQGLLSGVEKFYVNGNGLGWFASGVDLNGQRAVNVADPTSAQDAATRNYVDTTGNFPQWLPADLGLVAWAYDPALAVNASALTAGTVYVVRLKIPKATTLSSVQFYLSGTAGAGLSNCYVALYQGNSLLVQSADQSTSWNSTGNKTVSLTSTAVTAGFVDVAFWVGAATTAPSFSRSSGTGVVNAGIASSSNYRFATANTGVAATAPATLGTKTNSALGHWVAIS